MRLAGLELGLDLLDLLLELLHRLAQIVVVLVELAVFPLFFQLFGLLPSRPRLQLLGLGGQRAQPGRHVQGVLFGDLQSLVLATEHVDLGLEQFDGAEHSDYLVRKRSPFG